MTAFLETLAESIVASRIPLQEAAIILPNKRAKRMLLLAIANNYDKPVFAPAIFTIDDFMERLSPLECLDKVTLMVKLYEQYRKNFDSKSVDEVFTWAPAFVDDISEMDMQLADVITVFKDLSGAKAFEMKLGQDDLSQAQQDKIALYDSFADLYVQFGEFLREQHWGYPGMIYRDCAQNVDSYIQHLPYKYYVFAGFHVLNPAELSVVSYIKEHYNTQVYFDIDPFYCDFEKNERFTTAHFVKKICSRLEIPISELQYNHSYYKDQKKDVEIVGTSKTMNQIYYAIHCLKAIEESQGNLDDTALVLADEQLLVPFLSAYGIENANITMGYPFTATPAYTLLVTLFELYHQALQFAGAAQKLKFHRKHLITLFRSPLVRKYLFVNESQYQCLMKELESSQSAFYGVEDFKKLETEDLREDLLPSDEVSHHTLLQAVVNYLKTLLANIIDEQDASILKVLVEQLDETMLLLQPLLNVLSFYTMKYLVEQQVSTLTVPIKGDATKGLQVMGLLETRTMDFKNVVMLSVNEGTLPSGIRFNSLIPFDFKFSGETLENYLYKDQVYAYHFFRLLQRAEKVVLLYNNDSSASLAEKSRFISQLEFEVQEQHLDNIHLSYPIVNFPYQAEQDKLISIEKTDEIIQKVKSMSFSASALNNYIKCPLKFYMNNVCGIRERETFKDKIGMDAIGTVAHACFEEVFNQIMSNRENYAPIIDGYLADLDANVQKHFIATESLGLREVDLQQGRVILARKVVEHLVNSYLLKAKEELAQGTIEVIGNELQLDCSLTVGADEVRLNGIIDRLQLNDGRLEVVDYKTGKVTKTNLSIKKSQYAELFEDPKYDKLIQLIFYAILCRYNKNNVENADMWKRLSSPFKVRCAIVALQHINVNSNEYQHFAKYVEDEDGEKSNSESFDEEVLESFEGYLKGKLSEIMDAQVPFSQNETTDNCGYCEFRYLCHRV